MEPKEVQDTVQVVEEVKEESKQDPSQIVSEAFQAFPGAPTKDQIEQWKQKYGEVFCSGFSETELYIWRPVNRAEFVQMQAKVAEQSAKPMSNLDAEEMIVTNCVLWSSSLGSNALHQKAGSLTALHEQIMANSNFMDPRLAAALVIKL